ncbi:MAG: hypothetical protein Hals2KO_25880 [Halioglobus sp.]
MLAVFFGPAAADFFCVAFAPDAAFAPVAFFALVEVFDLDFGADFDLADDPALVLAAIGTTSCSSFRTVAQAQYKV